MWYQLGVFGSRVVEAVCVSEDKGNHHVESAVSAEEPEEDRAYGRHVRSEDASGVVKAAVSAEEPEEDRAYGGHVSSEGASCGVVRMDATALIAKRMGIEQGEVESKLLQLHQRGELDGTAGPPMPTTTARPMPIRKRSPTSA
jgi:hypothetical protein